MDNFKQTTIASLKLTRGLLKNYQLTPNKNLGQNFLINQQYLYKIIKACNIKPTDTLIEIGPGIGTISFELCKIAKKVILIEIDKSKEKVLKKVLENFNNYEIIWGDATNLRYEELFNKIDNLKIIGSLPFNVSKKIIFQLLKSNFKWNKAFFIVQKEVGEGYTSTPPKATFLYNFVSLYSQVEKKFIIKKINYYPIPKVDSLLIEFTQKNNINYELNNNIIKLLKTAFMKPRKTILNNLKNINIKKEDLEKIYIDTNKRPAELKLEEWQKIYELIFYKR